MHYVFKLIIAGDGGVGKTTLVNKLVNDIFLETTGITVGIEFMVKRLKVDGDVVDLQIWDLGGQERYRFILPEYCKGAHGALFIYDTTSYTSLQHMEDWMKLLRSQGGNFPVVAGGTKIDLPDVRTVPKEEAVEMASKFGILDVIEVSSKIGVNVYNLFKAISIHMLQKYQQSHQDLRSTIQVPNESTPRAG